MSWVTLIWGLVIGACATMALPHLLVGIQRRGRENLFFALAAFSVAGIAAAELGIMHSRTTQEIGRAQQLVHVPIFLLAVGIVGFIYFYFGTGRLWLGLAGVTARLLSLLCNFAFPPNVNFREVTSLRPMNFLGETISTPQGIPSPWTHLSELSSLLVLVYITDASIRLFRRGGAEERRRAVMVGGSLALFIFVAAGFSALIKAEILHLPHLVSLAFLGVILAMGFELSYDIFRAARMARELARSEAQLRESELRISLAAEAGKLALWVWNIARDEVWITDRGRALFGLSKSEPIDQAVFNAVVHPADRSRMEHLRRKALEEGGEYESEYRLAGSDGTPVWIAGFGRVELDHNGKAAFVHGVSRDITKRKMAEEALRESEARFRTVADIAPVMIWMSGTDKGCNFFNKGWLEYTGRSLQQELGNGWTEGVHLEDVAHCLGTYTTAFERREPFTMEYRLRRYDGEYHWVFDTGLPRFDFDSTFLGYIGSCIDIAERKQAELEHQLQSMELARVGRLALMGELAASLAHELFNPLAAMVTNASAGQRLLAHGDLEAQELRDLLGDIVADGHRARKVIEGIRNMVRRGEASHTLVDVADVIHDLLRIMHADAVAKKVKLIAEVDPKGGAVMGDRVQLLQVLLNLTLNAFEAVTVMRTEARRVVIRSRRTSEGKICICISDAGPGFPGGIADRLFEPFFSTKADGTGMGLAIARSIVEAHGGALSAENAAGGGALFTVSLPEACEAESRAA